MVKMHPSNVGFRKIGNISLLSVVAPSRSYVESGSSTASVMVTDVYQQPVQLPSSNSSFSLCGLIIGERFEVMGNEPLGSGSGGEVWEAKDLMSGECVALKRIDKRRIKEKQRESDITRDYSITSNNLLVSPKVALSDARFEEGTLFVSTPLRREGDLRNTLYNFGPLRLKTARSALADLLISLDFLHLKRIIHRDVKPENLYWDGQTLRLGDFGLARNSDSSGSLTPQMVTLWYRAPEVLLGSRSYSSKVDIFSAGCVFSELLIGKPLFKGRTEIDQLKLVFDLLGFPDLDQKGWPLDIPSSIENIGMRGNIGGGGGGGGNGVISKERWAQLTDKMPFGTSTTALDLMFKLMAVNPADRPSARDALFHPFFWEEPKVVEWRSLISNGDVFDVGSSNSSAEEQPPSTISQQQCFTPQPPPTLSKTPLAPLKLQTNFQFVQSSSSLCQGGSTFKAPIPIDKSSTLLKKPRGSYSSKIRTSVPLKTKAIQRTRGGTNLHF